MTRPAIELADIVRAFGPAFEEQYGHTLSPAQRQAMRSISRCRTAALGGHVEACDECRHQRIAYNSCRNRHCPKCQAAARAEWLDRQAEDLLPVEYFHVVFTLPTAVGPLALQNPRLVHGALFRAVAASLTELAADPKRLGAELGFLAVLHTWGQTLTLHPHVHCVVPGGGLSPDGTRWVSCLPGFFLPVKPLGRLFRGKFLALLGEHHARGRLRLAGSLHDLACPRRFAEWIGVLRATDWVVYAKPPFGGPEQVLRYLARYTHRVALANSRLVGMDADTVSFRWKDYADGDRSKVMTLSGVEFVRRFLQHVLPTGFVRIRHFGFLANRCRDEKLARCRALVGAPPPTTPLDESALEASPNEGDEPGVGAASPLPRCCPACGRGRMIVAEVLPRPSPRRPVDVSADTS
ncbi:MAG: IS91 family transposase [Gemmataceae bacterium]